MTLKQFQMRCMIVYLLITCVSYDCKARRKFDYFSFCKTIEVEVAIELAGCEKKTVKTVGCWGYCRSETTLLVYDDQFRSKCDCCKPRETGHFYVPVNCKNNEKKFAEVLTAKSCSCLPCGKSPEDRKADKS